MKNNRFPNRRGAFARAAALACLAAGFAAQASTDYGPAVWRPACNGKWYTTGNGKKFYVEHDMEGYYLGSIAYLNQCGVSASVHYAVNGLQDTGSDAPAGEVSQMVSDVYYAWHAGCWNQSSMGTEHEGWANNPAWYTTALYNASSALTRSKCVKYNIVKDRNHIVGHGEKSNSAWAAWAGPNLGINAYCNTHTDPGPYWNWTLYMSLVRGSKPGPDFDGNGTCDLALFRPSNGTWYLGPGKGTVAYGQSGDIPVAGDYTGSGVTTPAVFRPSTGTWYLGPGTTPVVYGQSGDLPIPGDYTGSGHLTIAVYRPSTATWYLGPGTTPFAWGNAGGDDVPVPGDFNGDGIADVAIYRKSNSTWYQLFGWTIAYGNYGDIPVPGDWNGDGSTELGLFRPSNGTWYRPYYADVVYGLNGDIPVPGDYTGDGITDICVFRPSNGTWYIPNTGTQYGQSGDIPAPSVASVRKQYFPY